MYETCRKCGRPVRSRRAMQCGYGEHCRRRVYRAARVLAASGIRTAEKAAEILTDGGLVRLSSHGGRAWQVVSSDGQRTYLATAEHCNCPAHLKRSHATLCNHNVAVSVMAA